jgi:hypothetical protein
VHPELRLLVNIKGLGKSYFLADGTESYFKKLRAAYSDIQGESKLEYLFFGFFTLCAATLEYSLNYLLTDYCVYQFGPEKYKTYAEGYINLSFGKKLTMTPHILSEGRLVINENNSSYKTLLELIALRNRILHNKEFLNEFDFPVIDANDKRENIEFQIKLARNHIDLLTKDKCLTFGNALGDFKTNIMMPWLNHELSENEMLIKVLK